jgi:ubiquinone/menaquinone biosynthesis C-methylase UbiE
MFTDPVKNLKFFGLRENDIVADLGAGTGYYSLPAAAMAPRGKVYAVEIDKDFLIAIKNKISYSQFYNIETLWGNVEKLGGTKIGNDVVDAVIASNILFQVEDKEKFIDEIKRILKQKGKVLLVDWSETSVFPAKGAVTKNNARLLFEKKGFFFQREIDAGAHHYGMILGKS